MILLFFPTHYSTISTRQPSKWPANLSRVFLMRIIRRGRRNLCALRIKHHIPVKPDIAAFVLFISEHAQRQAKPSGRILNPFFLADYSLIRQSISSPSPEYSLPALIVYFIDSSPFIQANTAEFLLLRQTSSRQLGCTLLCAAA